MARQRPNRSEAPAGAPDVSVLVPVFDEEAHIVAAARSMLAQRFDGEIEFLFIDGGSRDRSRALLEGLAAEDPRVRLLDNPERQTAAGLNVGLRHARGQYCVRMDAHTRYLDDYVARGVERLRRGDVEWVCGPAIPESDGPLSSVVARALRSRMTSVGSRKWPGEKAGGEQPVPPTSGVFGGVWSRETLERLGGWDEGWPVNQDVELLGRVTEAGGRVVQLEAMAGFYSPRDTLAGLARQYFRYGYYRVKTAGRHPTTLRRSHLLAASLPVLWGTVLIGRGRFRLLAAAGSTAHAATLATGAVRIASRSPAEAAALLAVMAVMHGSWGAGFLAGCARFGVPARALAAATGHAKKAGQSRDSV